MKEIGKMLLETPGLAEAMAKYMTPVIFANAFQQYVDKAKPELKAVAERLGDSSNNYCKAVKTRFAATSGWLWKPGDAQSVLEDVYQHTLCAEHIRRIAGLSGYLNFDDAMSHLSNAVLDENKVPMEFWLKKHPALQRFFELINRSPLSGEEVKAFVEIIEQQEKVIQEVFFDVANVRQLYAMREIFGEIWPRAVEEGRALYNAFSTDSAKVDEKSFKTIGRVKIEEYSRTLVSKQIAMLWHKCTGAKSPDEWSRKHAMPSEYVLAVDDAKSVVNAVANPGEVSAERLKSVYTILEKNGVFVDVTTAGETFLKQILPVRYQKIGLRVDELSKWLCNRLGDAPDRWLADRKLHEAVEAFIKQGYENHARKQAVEKVNTLSDAEAKKLLLELIDKLPDAGLSVLE